MCVMRASLLACVQHPVTAARRTSFCKHSQDTSMASDKAATQLLRVLSLNVHGWHNADKSSWEGLITMLKAMQPDVVALQEATKHRVPELAHELGDMHWTTRNNCAILSRLQLYVEHDQVRGCGRKKEERSGYAGKCKAAGAPHCDLKRGHFQRFCGAAIDVDGLPQPLEIVCLHLDHVRESNRLSQLRDLVLTRLTTGRSPLQVWCGDFNALSLRDYAEHEIRTITGQRAQNNWEPPLGHLTTMMTNPETKRATPRNTKSDPGLGFIDCWHAAEERFGPLGTSRFDSRIDYVFCSPALMAGGADVAKATVRSCQHLQTIPHVSDHNAVFVVLETTVCDHVQTICK